MWRGREDKDPTRRAVIVILTEQVLQAPNRAALMKEMFPEDGKRCAPTSEEAVTVVKEPGESRPTHGGEDPAVPRAEVWPPRDDGHRASKGPRKRT